MKEASKGQGLQCILQLLFIEMHDETSGVWDEVLFVGAIYI